MKSKKFLALLLALALVLVACGQNNETKDESKTETNVESSTESNEESNSESKEETGKLEDATIVFWHAMNGAQEEALTKMTEDFMKKYPNVKVELQNQTGYQELQQKITATSQSEKDLPTLTQAYPDWMFDLIQDGLVHDLTDFTSKVDSYDDILEGFRKGTEFEGKVYSMPFNKSTEVLWYNEDMLKELKLEAPKNLEELVEVSKKIHEAKGIPGVGFDSLSNFFTTFLNSEGVAFDDQFDPTSEASKKAVQYYLDGVKEGYFRIAGSDKYMSGPFGSEQVAMYIGSNAGESYVLEGSAGKFQPKAIKSPFPASIQQGTDLFVFEKANDAEKAATYEYLKFITEKENQTQWGIKTGYIPVRKSSIESDEYKNSGSLIAPILGEATKSLYSNPVLRGANQAYREAGTVLETLLADPNKADVEGVLNNFKTTLEGIWNQ